MGSERAEYYPEEKFKVAKKEKKLKYFKWDRVTQL
jgi:hypothetical protein